ncbi:MAG: hypothetical protein CBD63_02045 [Candidatus Pelagibacter sp. TMED203]|nr:MAG: hypothetical protein CBD63_02045 [Candidatus Pelagibacter sp. TMED203]
MENKLKTLTIVGASGFLGRSIVDYAKEKKLLKWKINKITSISRRRIYEKSKKNLYLKYITEDIKKLKKLPKTDYIIYAVNSSNNKNDKNALKNFICMLKKLPKKTKILFTSSGAVYGKIKSKKKYSKSKILTEKEFKKLGKQGYKVSIARLFTFIGKRILTEKKYAISDFIKAGRFHKKIVVKSKFKVYRSYMHSYDMVKWLLTILVNSNIKCPIYNVGSNENISLQNLARIIGDIFNKPVEIKKISSKKIERYAPSIKKAQKELKLKINYNLRTSLYSIIK